MIWQHKLVAGTTAGAHQTRSDDDAADAVPWQEFLWTVAALALMALWEIKIGWAIIAPELRRVAPIFSVVYPA
jgi:hypothetical protein